MTPFSASLGHIGLSQSWRHAWTACPALNPQYQPEERVTFDRGRAAHRALLGAGSDVVVLEFADFRTKLAQTARDAIRAEGKTPVLAHQWAEVSAMVEAARQQLADWDDPVGLLEPERGLAEVTSYLELDGVAVRVTPDWHTLDHGLIADYKSTEGSAHPAVWSKSLWSSGAAIQQALYRRAFRVLHGRRPEWRWVVQENYPPYALAVLALDPEAEAFADQQLDAALAGWKRCLETNRWPAYPPRVAYAEVPGYLVAAWEQRQYFEVVP